MHERIADAFVDALARRFEEVIPGMPWEDARLTPVISPEHARYLRDLIEDALQHGAAMRNRDGGRCEGTLMHPALLTGITPAMRVFHEEQFGPVVPVLRFSEEDEALDYVKRARYGQQCSIFGSTPGQLRRLVTAAARYVGRVNINGKCQRGPDHFPFTGKRDSALGTVSVEEALRRFCISTVIATPEYPSNTELWRRLF